MVHYRYSVENDNRPDAFKLCVQTTKGPGDWPHEGVNTINFLNTAQIPLPDPFQADEEFRQFLPPIDGVLGPHGFHKRGIIDAKLASRISALQLNNRPLNDRQNNLTCAWTAIRNDSEFEEHVKSILPVETNSTYSEDI